MIPGPHIRSDGSCAFVVWAPGANTVELQIESPRPLRLPMKRDRSGYWQILVPNTGPGTRYRYVLNGSLTRPDPASHYQPQGVHEASSVVDTSSFTWTDSAWRGIPLREMILYELHVGTFTREGTFDAVIGRLAELKELGINAVELMPVAQFPGRRNWGYDGVYPYAVQHSYGGPHGLQRLVDACHRTGMAVILDVVYNHIGPEGNYLADFGPYFTSRHMTPWGPALNFDGPESDDVRTFFIENALYWLRDFHIDGLRADAIHAIYDMSPRPFLQELNARVAEFAREDRRPRYVIAEDHWDDPRVITPGEHLGLGFDAVWCDDFHHSVHTLLTGENTGYYADYGEISHLVKCYREGFVYTGEYSHWMGRRHGRSSAHCPPEQFVVYTQNHDQVGNRLSSDRLCNRVSFEAAKLASGAMLCSPYVPLLFMGEEFAAGTPFPFFVDYPDPKLNEAVRSGREREFARFAWGGTIPHPKAEETFRSALLRWEERTQGHHAVMLRYYRALLALRREHAALGVAERSSFETNGDDEKRVIWMVRRAEGEKLLVAMNFGAAELSVTPPLDEAPWRVLVDSAAAEWNGPGTLLAPVTEGQVLRLRPWSIALFIIK